MPTTRSKRTTIEKEEERKQESYSESKRMNRGKVQVGNSGTAAPKKEHVKRGAQHKKTMAKSNPFNRFVLIPEDCLVNIIQFLEMDDIFKVNRVCKLWHKAAENKRGWKYTSIYIEVANEMETFSSKLFYNIPKLYLFPASEIEDSQQEGEDIENTSDREDIDEDIDEEQNEEENKPEDRTTETQTLVLTDKIHFERFAQLDLLNIEYPELASEQVAKICQTPTIMKHLRELELEVHSYPPNFFDIVSECNLLEGISISGRYMPYKTFPLLAKCTQLKYISLQEVSPLDEDEDSFLKFSAFTTCKQLNSIKLTCRYSHVTKKELLPLTQLVALYIILELCVSEDDDDLDTCVCYFKNLPNLIYLYVGAQSQCPAGDDCCGPALGEMNSLRFLGVVGDVFRYFDITSITSLSHLRVLSLTECWEGPSMTKLARNVPNLMSLDISHTGIQKFEDFLALRNLPNLKYMNFVHCFNFPNGKSVEENLNKMKKDLEKDAYQWIIDTQDASNDLDFTSDLLLTTDLAIKMANYITANNADDSVIYSEKIKDGLAEFILNDGIKTHNFLIAQANEEEENEESVD